jgi:phosphoribosyl-dephospho-CoA transferase
MFARHNLVWLSPDGWEGVAAAADRCRDTIALWCEHDWPTIVRRADHGTPEDVVCVGIAAPPSGESGQKIRIPLRVDRRHVQRAMQVPALASVVDAVPGDWKNPLAALSRDAASRGLQLQVFGSVAMQAITGRSYLTANSDIDVLCRPHDAAQLASAVDLLRAHAAHLPLDGEIEFPDGRAASWKEWAAYVASDTECDGAMRVLTKHVRGVALTRVDELMKSLGVCHA